MTEPNMDTLFESNETVNFTHDGSVVSAEVPQFIARSVLAAENAGFEVVCNKLDSEDVEESVRKSVPEQFRAPSHKQVMRAFELCGECGVTPEPSVFMSQTECSEFIGTQLAELKKTRNEIKDIVRSVSKIARGKRAEALLLAGKTEEEAATELGITPPTIQKYLGHLAKWNKNPASKENGSYIHSLIERALAGENLYSYLYEQCGVSYSENFEWRI